MDSEYSVQMAIGPDGHDHFYTVDEDDAGNVTATEVPAPQWYGTSPTPTNAVFEAGEE